MSASSPTASSAAKPLLSSKVYNILKYVAMYGLPLLAAAYFVGSQAWNWPDPAGVMATIATVNGILGGLLHYSTATYASSESRFAGILEVVETLEKNKADIYTLNLGDKLPEAIKDMGEAIFKVVVQAPKPTPAATPSVVHGASIPPQSST